MKACSRLNQPPLKLESSIKGALSHEPIKKGHQGIFLFLRNMTFVAFLRLLFCRPFAGGRNKTGIQYF
jgi:hypothetical protein